MQKPLSYDKWFDKHEDELIYAFDNQTKFYYLDDFYTDAYISYLESFEDYYE